MNHKLILTFLLLLNCLPGKSNNPDSLFLFKLKEFAFKTLDYKLTGEFYTVMDTVAPQFYVFYCPRDTIFAHSDYSTAFIYCGTNLERANYLVSQYTKNGYHSFCYKAFANSSAHLNSRFLSYSKETQAFIVLHELMHNFIFQKKLKIPYSINEAMCDIFGNYGAQAFSKETTFVNNNKLLKQQKKNEKFYECVNKYVLKVNQKNIDSLILYSQCEKEMAVLLQETDAFQKDRFSYSVNNAYLAKNYYYSKHYFLLKRVMLKQKGLPQLIKILEKMPATEEECVKYLEKF